MKENIETKESKITRGISAVVTFLLVLSVMLCIYAVFQLLSDGHVDIGGYMMFRVVTGSMEPTMSVGSLIVAKAADITSIAVGDIVCFRTYNTQIYGSVVTHRVVDIIQDAQGVLLQTKGDANLIADGYYVSQDNMIGKVIWFAGENNVLTTVFSFFTNKVGFLGCIVVPCLLLAGLVLRNCVNNIHSELAMSKDEEMAMPQVEGSNPTVSMTSQEYEEMIHRIRAELTEELLQKVRTNKGERDVGILEEEKTDTIQ